MLKPSNVQGATRPSGRQKPRHVPRVASGKEPGRLTPQPQAPSNPWGLRTRGHPPQCADQDRRSPLGPESPPPRPPEREKAASARQRPQRRPGRRTSGHWEPCHSRDMQHGAGDGGQQPRPLASPRRRAARSEGGPQRLACPSAHTCVHFQTRGAALRGPGLLAHPRAPGTGCTRTRVWVADSLGGDRWAVASCSWARGEEGALCRGSLPLM